MKRLRLRGWRQQTPWIGLGVTVVGLGAAAWWAFFQQEADMPTPKPANTPDDFYKFTSALPVAGQALSDIFWRVGHEMGISPFILAAVCQKETRFGAALDSTGTGDYTPRDWTPWPLPPDGLGWGRGLMQLDYYYHRDWLGANDWRNPEVNFRKAASVLREKVAYFARHPITPSVSISAKAAAKWGLPIGSYPDVRPLEGDALISAALAAYNGNYLNVLGAMGAGLSPDAVTTGKNYGGAVQATANTYLANFLGAGGTLT